MVSPEFFGIFTHFEQRGVILGLREVWSVRRKPYKHCWTQETERGNDMMRTNRRKFIGSALADGLAAIRPASPSRARDENAHFRRYD